MPSKGRPFTAISALVIGLSYTCLLYGSTSVASETVIPSKSSKQALSVKVINGLTGNLKRLEDTYCGTLLGDDITVIVYDGSKELYNFPYCSSYGKAKADLITDAKGKSYILLDFGRGRGTNAVTEYLDVFPVQKDMVEYAQIPLSEGAGPTSRWDYSYKIIAPPSGGISVLLTMHIDGDGPVWVKLPDKTRIVGIGTTEQDGPTIFRSGDPVF